MVKGTLQWFTRNACVGCQCSITGIRRTNFFFPLMSEMRIFNLSKKNVFSEIFSFKHQSTKISILRWRCLLMPCLRRREASARKGAYQRIVNFPVSRPDPILLTLQLFISFSLFSAAVRQMPFDKENRGLRIRRTFSPALECIFPPKYFIAPKSNSGARRRKHTQKGKEWLQESCFVWIQSKSFTSPLQVPSWTKRIENVKF